MAEVIDQQVVDQIVKQYSTGQIARNRTAIAKSIASRKMDPYNAKSCSTGTVGITASQRVNQYGTAVASTTATAAGGVAAAAAASGTAAVGASAALVAIGPFAALALPILFGLGLISKHHAAAVAKEQGDLCGTVPQLQAALDQADSLFASGAAPASLLADLGGTSKAFKDATQGIFKECNAACFYQREFDAQIDVRRRVDYQRGAGAGALAFVKRNKVVLGLTTAAVVVAWAIL